MYKMYLKLEKLDNLDKNKENNKIKLKINLKLKKIDIFDKNE